MENTIVVYTSDQGFYLGEKGFFDKRFMYEESFRMPFMIQYPGKIKAGIKVSALTQNLDFAQTFLDYANADDSLTVGMQGKSFKPLLDGKISQDDFREAIYYHYYDYPAFQDRKSTRLNSSHVKISYAVFCLKKKKMFE